MRALLRLGRTIPRKSRISRKGAGGYRETVNEKWKAELVGDVSEQMSWLQRDTGIKADVFIGSRDVPKVLSQAAKQRSADLLVTRCYPYGGHLRTHGYGIICAVQIRS